MRRKKEVISPVFLEEKQSSQRSMAESQKGCEYESDERFSARQFMQGSLGLCWSQYFSQSSSIVYLHWLTTLQLKSRLWSPPALQGCIHVKMQCSQQNMAHLGVWSCGAEGGWDSGGRGSSCFSPSESNFPSPFLARDGTKKHSPRAALLSAYSKISTHHVNFSRRSGSLGL